MVVTVLVLWGPCRAEEDAEEGDERTFGLFRRHKHHAQPGYVGGGGLFSGFFGQLFGGSPYYGNG